MSSDFNFLLESGQFSDVTIKCEGTRLSCHKVILGARLVVLEASKGKLKPLNPRSPVFNAMFIHNMTENQKKEIDIEDLEIDTVKDLL